VNNSQWIFMLATLLGASGMWLLLPRGGGRAWIVGAALMATALGLGASRLPGLGHWVASGAFFLLAGVTLLSAVATVTFRNPVYCAVWFGMSLLGTAGLFLLAGAQFLAVATLVVYAGAILVTFLFVLMLAQPKGKAVYDRVSWEALVSAALGMVIVGILSMELTGVLTEPVEAGQPPAASATAEKAAKSAGQRSGNVLAQEHVARFGAELFGRHLIAVEVAGTLLLAALVGAAVIAAQSRSDQPERPPGDSQEKNVTV
jgi:NADH-quinone oxidoreductase subunit J